MRVLSLCVLGLSITACSTAPYHALYITSGSPEQRWIISGQAQPEARRDKIIININDELAITGLLSAKTPQAEFSGSYRQHALSAKCSMQASGLLYDHTCSVYVDGKFAVFLKF